jgi:hypothetical protein
MTSPDAVISEPALLIRIARLHSPGMTNDELYEATRGVWRIGSRRDGARLALAVARGLVVEVYELGAWHAAGSTPYATRPLADVDVPGRWEFSGRVASAAVRDKYLGKSVAHHFARGAVNPIAYVNL